MCMPEARVFNSDETATAKSGRLWPPNGGCLEKIGTPIVPNRSGFTRVTDGRFRNAPATAVTAAAICDYSYSGRGDAALTTLAESAKALFIRR
jgi:hypothetical protein